jgi:hypothetical protein
MQRRTTRERHARGRVVHVRPSQDDSRHVATPVRPGPSQPTRQKRASPANGDKNRKACERARKRSHSGSVRLFQLRDEQRLLVSNAADHEDKHQRVFAASENKSATSNSAMGAEARSINLFALFAAAAALHKRITSARKLLLDQLILRRTTAISQTKPPTSQSQEF